MSSGRRTSPKTPCCCVRQPLVALAEVDEDLARFHAARLLVDPYVQPMSGEPAASAARVLGILGEQTVLWSYVFAQESPRYPEVTGECLRQLVVLPESLLGALIERYSEKPPSAVLLGLVDLLINHHTGPHGREFLTRQLQTTRDADILSLYRHDHGGLGQTAAIWKTYLAAAKTPRTSASLPCWPRHLTYWRISHSFARRRRHSTENLTPWRHKHPPLQNARPGSLAARPKTLPAALSPVVVGAALAAAAGTFDLLPCTRRCTGRAAAANSK